MLQMVMLEAPPELKMVIPEVLETAMQESLDHQVPDPHQVVETGTLNNLAGEERSRKYNIHTRSKVKSQNGSKKDQEKPPVVGG
jgi:hypothetical protein